MSDHTATLLRLAAQREREWAERIERAARDAVQALHSACPLRAARERPFAP